LLHDYHFQTLDLSQSEFLGGNEILNDTVWYSFESQDSIVAIRKTYNRSEKGEDKLSRIDTIYRKYEITNNTIRFTSFDWQLYKLLNMDYLLGLKWTVISLNDRELRIELLLFLHL